VGGYPWRVTGTQAPTAFRLAYVPGVTPGKWVRTWQERKPETPLELAALPAADAPGALRDGTAHAALLRLPIDRAGLSVIPLYTETSVVVVPKDHEVTALEQLPAAELDDYLLLCPLDDTLEWERRPARVAEHRPDTTGEAVELVAAGMGLLVVPQSLARLHHRKDLTYRPLTGAPCSSVALSWPQEHTTDQVEDFIGIVRGRTVNSTRGRPAPSAETAKPGKTARAAGGGAAPAKQGKQGKQAAGARSAARAARARPRRRR
jgi:DNA-binding transcriptional LysR family regulator